MSMFIYRGALRDRTHTRPDRFAKYFEAKKRAELDKVLGVTTEKSLAFKGVYDVKTGLYIPATKETK